MNMNMNIGFECRFEIIDNIKMKKILIGGTILVGSVVGGYLYYSNRSQSVSQKVEYQKLSNEQMIEILKEYDDQFFTVYNQVYVMS